MQPKSFESSILILLLHLLISEYLLFAYQAVWVLKSKVFWKKSNQILNFLLKKKIDFKFVLFSIGQTLVQIHESTLFSVCSKNVFFRKHLKNIPK